MMASRLFKSLLFSWCLSLIGLVFLSIPVQADISHRKSDVTIRVEDPQGNALTSAIVDVEMKRHDFRFGTQIRDEFFSITQSSFNALTTTQKQNLLPDQTAFGAASRFTPTYQDVQNYRDAVFSHFNYVVPTVGMQWRVLNNEGPSIPDSTIALAQFGNMEIAAASVVWQRDQWPTPTQFESQNNPNPTTFHNALINDRLGSNSVMARFSSGGAGANITEWKVLNEPLNETYYADTFVNAGIYQDDIEAMADYFIRADTTRPDARLMINEFNILNWTNNNEAIRYRDLINDLLNAGAPIDVIGVQAHMARANISKSDMVARLDILAQTGLPIEITEFDMRDDPNTPFPSYVPLTPAEQEQMFRDILEASFEHTAVEGFDMWGFWDPGHWRYNGPLYDDNWNIKAEAAPWFDLVEGDWMPDLPSQLVDLNGEWMLAGGLIKGTYDFEVTVNGITKQFTDIEVTQDGTLILEIPSPDINGDGFIDGLDLGILLANWGQSTTSDMGELNGTPPVDGLDLGILLGAWNPPPLNASVTVPEPTSICLICFFAVALLATKNIQFPK